MPDMMDEILGPALAANASFVAGVKAADEHGPAARKLRRLLAAVEAGPAAGWRHCKCRECTELRTAIAEARKP